MEIGGPGGPPRQSIEDTSSFASISVTDEKIQEITPAICQHPNPKKTSLQQLFSGSSKVQGNVIHTRLHDFFDEIATDNTNRILGEKNGVWYELGSDLDGLRSFQPNLLEAVKPKFLNRILYRGNKLNKWLQTEALIVDLPTGKRLKHSNDASQLESYKENGLPFKGYTKFCTVKEKGDSKTYGWKADDQDNLYLIYNGNLNERELTLDKVQRDAQPQCINDFGPDNAQTIRTALGILKEVASEKDSLQAESPSINNLGNKTQTTVLDTQENISSEVAPQNQMATTDPTRVIEALEMKELKMEELEMEPILGGEILNLAGLKENNAPKEAQEKTETLAQQTLFPKEILAQQLKPITPETITKEELAQHTYLTGKDLDQVYEQLFRHEGEWLQQEADTKPLLQSLTLLFQHAKDKSLMDAFSSFFLDKLPIPEQFDDYDHYDRYHSFLKGVQDGIKEVHSTQAQKVEAQLQSREAQEESKDQLKQEKQQIEDSGNEKPIKLGEIEQDQTRNEETAKTLQDSLRQLQEQQVKLTETFQPLEKGIASKFGELRAPQKPLDRFAKEIFDGEDIIGRYSDNPDDFQKQLGQFSPYIPQINNFLTALSKSQSTLSQGQALLSSLLGQPTHKMEEEQIAEGLAVLELMKHEIANTKHGKKWLKNIYLSLETANGGTTPQMETFKEELKTSGIQF